MIGDKFEQYSFDYLMAKALSYVPEGIDKRQGSIIYDALAPACQELALAYVDMRNIYKETFVQTSVGEALDLRVAEQSVVRYAATYALKRADFFDSSGAPMSVPIGSRYSTVSDTNPINYVVESAYKTDDGQIITGAYCLRCEQLGTIGNEYTGAMTNITFVQGLARVEMSTPIEPARDAEDDESLRSRYFEIVSNKPFGGNIAQYREEVSKISGGQVQVYPSWAGGGTVKCSTVDNQTNPISTDFIKIIQNAIDPENIEGVQGTGLGIAPVGHVVSISTPDEIDINITCKIYVKSGYQLENLRAPITQEFDKYIMDIRKSWGTPDEYNEYSCVVYISGLVAAALNVPGIANLADVTINGVSEDAVLIESGVVQQIPVLGRVTLNE